MASRFFCLRGYKAAAPLKPGGWIGQGPARSGPPRLQSRGPIEASASWGRMQGRRVPPRLQSRGPIEAAATSSQSHTLGSASAATKPRPH